MNIISITKNSGMPNEEKVTIETSGYTILYLDGEKVKFTGEVPLTAFAPLIMKAVAKRFNV